MVARHGLRRIDGIGWVANEHFPLHRLRQRAFQDDVHVMHRARRKAAMAIPAAAGERFGVGLRYLRRFQFWKRYSTQQRRDVLSTNLLVTLVRLWRDAWLNVVQPPVKELRHGGLVRLKYVPQLSCEIRRAHSICAARFVPVNECQRRLRLPVATSRTSRTIAQWPGDRSRMCPFIALPLFWAGPARSIHLLAIR